jgi:ABC-type branched-subunit amino acid transport system ATPase component
LSLCSEPTAPASAPALRAISGLLAPASGDILYCGKSIAKRRPDPIVRDGIAQSPARSSGRFAEHSDLPTGDEVERPLENRPKAKKSVRRYEVHPNPMASVSFTVGERP